MAKLLSTVVLAALCISIAAGMDRKLMQAPAPGPVSPAPEVEINGVEGYSCPSPGSTGYLFQPAPCAYGPYAGQKLYCDLAYPATTGAGVVGIRNATGRSCAAATACADGSFCNVHTKTCSPVATFLCFAGAPIPAPAPSPA